MTNYITRKSRSVFATALARQLEAHGRVWSGVATYCMSPKPRVIVLCPTGDLYDLTVEGYYSPVGESLCRVRCNENWLMPARFSRYKKNRHGPPTKEVEWRRGCPRVEFTLRDSDLLAFIPFAVELMTGAIRVDHSYYWDPRAIATLDEGGPAHFARFALDMIRVSKRGATNANPT